MSLSSSKSDLASPAGNSKPADGGIAPVMAGSFNNPLSRRIGGDEGGFNNNNL